MGSGVSTDQVLTRNNVENVRAAILKNLEKTPILDPKYSKNNLANTYQINPEERLGMGGCSIVLGCTEIATGRKLVCKIMTKCKISNTYLLLGSTLGEILALIRKTTKTEVDTGLLLKHPNIINTLNAYENTSGIFLIQERCSGGELFEYVNERQGITEAMLVNVFRQILLALSYIHSKNIVHRDLKPENVLLQTLDTKVEDSVVKLIDFGMAKKLSGKKRRGTQVGSRMYVPPEIKFDTEAGQSTAADMYSFGVLAFVLISGHYPYSDSDFHQMCEAKKISLKFPEGESDWDNVAPSAKEFVSNLIMYDPSKRMTAEEALGHPYLTKPRKSSLQRLKSISSKKSVENQILNKRMSIRKSIHMQGKSTSWSADVTKALGSTSTFRETSKSVHY